MSNKIKSRLTQELIRVQSLDDGYFTNAAGQAVFVWEISDGINLFIKDSAQINSIIEAYSRLFVALQEQDILQLISSFRPLDPELIMAQYRTLAGENLSPGRAMILPAQEAWVNQMASSSGTGTLKFYLLYTRVIQPNQSAEAHYEAVAKNSINLLGYLSRVGNLDVVKGLSAKALGKAEIQALLDRELNPFMLEVSPGTLNHTAPLREPGGFTSAVESLARDAFVVAKDHLETGSGCFFRTHFVETLPFDNYAKNSTTGEFEYVASPFAQQIQLQCGYHRISFYAYGLNQRKVFDKFNIQFVRAEQKLHMQNSHDAKTSAMQEHTRFLLDRAAQGRTTFNRASMYITLYATTLAELDDHSNKLETILQEFHFKRGFYEQDRLLANSLPCACELAGKPFYTTSDGCANAFAMTQARVGMRTGAVIGFDPIGEPVHFNQWAKDEIENPVHVVLGSMGSGKSFMQELIEIRQAPLDVITCIFHKSNSYDFSTRLLDGQILDYHLDSETKLNIFDPDDESELTEGPKPETVMTILDFLDILLADNYSNGLNKSQRAILEQSVRDTYAAQRGEIPILEDCANILTQYAKNKEYADHHPLIKDLRLRLSPFVGQGAYARLTNCRSNVDIRSNRVVMNLSKISDSDPTLFALSMYVATSVVWKVLAGNKGKPFVKVKFDETWAFLKSPMGAKLIDNLTRRVRHLAIAEDIVTQYASDLLESPAAKSILQGAKCVTILQQESASLPLIKEIFQLNDAEMNQIRHLNQVKGVYSQAFMITGKRRGLVNIMPDAFTYWAATSEPNVDVPKRQAAIARHTNAAGSAVDYTKVMNELMAG
jgi:hypothetical protein